MAGLLLGIDLGTTGTKVALVDPDSGTVTTESAESSLISDGPGIAEADTHQWWENVCQLVPAVVAAHGADPADIAAVACSGMVPAVVFLADDRPVRNAILQNDARAVAEIEELSGELADLDLVALTGSPLSQQSVGPTLRWLARHEPDVWAATDHVVGSYDWLARALGGDLHVEINWAIESGLYTVAGESLAEAVAATGLAHRSLAPVVDPGTTVGRVSGPAATATGLVEGTPVVVGGADHVLSAYAAGLQTPGDLLVKLGGAGDILVVTDFPMTDARLYLDAHPVPGRWLPNGCMATSGSLIRWFQSIAGGDLETLDAEAAQAAPGDLLCLPYFLGEKSPLHDPNLRGAFVGLHLGHDRGAMFRAVLEAVGFGFRHHLEVFAERGCDAHRAFVSNGGSRSTLWKQIVADILGLELVPVHNHPGASLGAALLAGVGTGVVDLGDELDYVEYGEPIRPDPDTSAFYAERYQVWREAGRALTPVSHTLADGR